MKDIIERKADFTDEEDKLLIKRAEIALARKYNYFRAPFMAIASTISVLAAFNTRLSPFKRIAPVFCFAPLIVFYNKNVGMYGVQREIDDVLFLMAGEEKN